MSDQNVDALGLGLDLNTVDTARPVLPEQIHALAIDKVDIQDSKSKAGNRNLVVTFKSVNDSPDVTGARIISAGYPITKYYPLQQSDNPKAPDFQADLARLQDAVEGSKQGERGPFNPYNYVGKIVLAKLKVRKDDEFGDSNEISKLEFAS